MIIFKIPLSDSDFSQKILRKYQKGKWNFLNFPLMIFSKNTGYALPMDFKINILMQLNFHNQRIISHVINENNKWMNNWVTGIDNFLSELIYRPIILKNIRNTRKSINFQYETISGFARSIYEFLPGQFKKSILFFNNLNRIYSLESTNAISRKSTNNFSSSNQILRYFIKNHNEKKTLSYHYINKYIERYSGFVDKSSYKAMYSNLLLNNKTLKNPALYQQNFAISSEVLDNQNLSFSNYIHNINSPIFWSKPQKSKNFMGNNLFENNSSKYNLKYNLSLLINDKLNPIGKNSFNEINQNPITFIQPIINNNKNKSSRSSGFKSFKRRDMEDNDNFTFQDNRQIDRKIEQIKKLSEEAKEIVSRKFLEGSSGRPEIQPEIDINRLSNKVYKMIEYNLKIEKERRGYL
jgi:hypothetical protein